jgi:hypothetical protein
MGLLGEARANTAVGVSPETFLLLLHGLESRLWTHQTTAGPRQLLGPRSSLSVRHAYTLLSRSRLTAHRQAHRRFVVRALRHSAATREQVDAAVTTFIGCFGRLWRVPRENGYKEVFLRLAVNGVRAAGACQHFFSPHALVVFWAQVPMEIANGCGSMLSGSVRSLSCPHSGAARVGGSSASSVAPVAG